MKEIMLQTMFYGTIVVALIANVYLTIYVIKAGIELYTPEQKWERSNNG